MNLKILTDSYARRQKIRIKKTLACIIYNETVLIEHKHKET